MLEQRNFSRILFLAQACLFIDQEKYPVKLLDISLKGALVEKPPRWQTSNHAIKLQFKLNDNESEITMNVAVSHEDKQLLGLKCLHIDIDSISLLRRLIELNIGDEALLQREIEQLIISH